MAPEKKEAGFTFVEVLIVAAILAFIMAGVFGIYQATQKSTLFATAGEDAQLTARAVLDRIVSDFQLIKAGCPASGCRCLPPVCVDLNVPTGIVNAAGGNVILLGDVDNTVDAGRNVIVLNAFTDSGATTLTLGALDNTGAVVALAGGTDLTRLFPCGSALVIADGPIIESHPLAATNCVTGNTLTLAEPLLTWYPGGAIVRSVEAITYAWDGADRLCRAVGAACVAPYPDNLTIATGVTNFQITWLDPVIRVQLSVRTQSGEQIVTRSMEVTVKRRNL